MPSSNRQTILTARNSNYPGVRIKALRLALGITTRGVEEYSRRISRLAGNKAFLIPHSSLSEMEKPGAEPPGICKLFSLCVIYRVSFRDLLDIYGLNLEEIPRWQMEIQLPQTHLISPDVHDLNRRVTFPVKINPELDLSETHLLSRMVQAWGEIPLAFLQHVGIKKRLYGYVGMKDFTLHPFIPPGSLVQIDDRDTRIQSRGWETNFDRPIYFLQLREGFACGWCQVDGGNLSIIPFSASRWPVRRFPFPGDVDVVGRVTGVAMSLTSHRPKVLSDIADRSA
ncbi:MAG: hypothetical protein DMG49_12510 [Acidobacteria bacterium]|nr:MAG: hypothetical protein DMG49_12510 [Acidobacteriota bacterium]